MEADLLLVIGIVAIAAIANPDMPDLFHRLVRVVAYIRTGHTLRAAWWLSERKSWL